MTREHWRALGLAWLGWGCDALDATIFLIVLHSALEEVLASPAVFPRGGATSYFFSAASRSERIVGIKSLSIVLYEKSEGMA